MNGWTLDTLRALTPDEYDVLVEEFRTEWEERAKQRRS